MKERYKDHSQNIPNISIICLQQNTNKQVAQSVNIICTRKRNQVQCLQIISNDLLLCEQNCTNGWELDDHRFQSKLVIIPFYFRLLPSDGRSHGQHIPLIDFCHSFESLTRQCFMGIENWEVPKINEVVIDTLQGELTIVKA